MYNAELKQRFISDYTTSDNTKSVVATVFEAFSSYENAWKADLCTKGAEELQPVVDEVFSLRLRSQWMQLIVLKEYAKWCIAMKVPGACDGMLHIEAAGLAKVKRQLVSGPLHLQRCMNEIFDPESEETIDILYRCYYWLAYAGIKEVDLPTIKTSDIDFDNMVILYNGSRMPIYREALPALHKAAELTSFCYKHPNYKEVIRRDRVAGDSIMRGVRADTKTYTIRAILSKKSAIAIESGRTTQRLSYHRVWISGLFYRMYENERAGAPVNFSDAAIEFTDGKNYTLTGRTKLEHRRNSIARDYLNDYQRWKLAFSI